MAIFGNPWGGGGGWTPTRPAAVAPTPTYAQQQAARFGFPMQSAPTRPAAVTPTPATPTYAQQQAARFGLATGSPVPQTQFGMAQAGRQYGNWNPQQPFGMAAAGQRQQPAATAAPPRSPIGPPPAGTPSTAGATTQNPGGTYVNGQWVPSITQTTTLSPAEQDILNKTQGFQQTALGAGTAMAGALPTGGLNLSNAPAMPTAGQYNQSAASAVWDQQKAMLDPQWQVQEQQLRDSLRDQGIPPGSPAYNQQMDQLDRQRTLAYQQAHDAAIQEGYNVANQQFGQGMEARQQGVAEAGQQYQMPVSNLAQLMSAYTGTGGVQAPQGQAQPSQIAPPDLSQAFQTQQTALQNQYAQQANMYGQNVGGLSGLAGMLALAAGGNKGWFG